MQAIIAEIVDEVVRYGLDLKQRLERGEAFDFGTEQAELKKRLKGDVEARHWEEYGGDSATGVTLSGARRESFLGIRYALVCWLDEIFILDSPWAAQWNEQNLEHALFGSRDRAWKFWEQAKRAEGRMGTDALEAFYLCVMLGFRGDLRESPEQLRVWRDGVELRISKGLDQEYSLPPEKEAPRHATPRRARERMQTMLLATAAALALLIPAATFYVVYQLGSK